MFVPSLLAAPGMITGALTMAHMGTTHTLVGLVSQYQNLQLLQKRPGHRACQSLCHKVRICCLNMFVFLVLNSSDLCAFPFLFNSTGCPAGSRFGTAG